MTALLRDYALHAWCRQCDHRMMLDVRTLAAIAGWEIEIEALRWRLRCTNCGKQDCVIGVGPISERTLVADGG